MLGSEVTEREVKKTRSRRFELKKEVEIDVEIHFTGGINFI